MTPSTRDIGSFRFGKVCGASLALLAACAVSAPGTAAADIPAERVEFFMYGRMGIGWGPSGQVVAGKYMNLGPRRAIGGRLEEGDYLQPGFRFHLKKGDSDTDTKVDIVSDFEMFSMYGSIVSDLSNGDLADIKIMPLQAYVEAKNVLTEGLTMWLGSRLYRKNDIHICDYFYFNNLSSTGAGVMYGGLDTAVLTQTGDSPFFQTDLNAGSPAPAPTTPAPVKRQRTMFVAQYKVPFGPSTSFVQGLGEAHIVPKSGDANRVAAPTVNPSDHGWVAGLKLHLDLGSDSFNDTSVRYGTRIANGAESGGSTFHTFGVPGLHGTYRGAYGVELVEHFMWNVGRVFTLNGYGTMHYSQGSNELAPAVDEPIDGAAPPPPPTVLPPNRRFDYSFGARPTLYVTDQFHLVTEATYQTRKDDALPMGTAVKLSVVPTVVPTGERSAWARPQIRLIYTVGFYNGAAVDQLMSPYLKTMGPTRVAQFLGLRTEWWF